MGVNDTAPRSWDGQVRVTGGQLAAIRDWRPRAVNSVDPQGSWKLSSVKGLNFNWRAWEQMPDVPRQDFVWSQGVVVDVRGQAPQVNVTTPQGNFSFRAAELNANRPASFLNGSVRVHRTPAAEHVSGPSHQTAAESASRKQVGRIMGFRLR